MKITRVRVINTLRKHAETKSVKNCKGQGRKILSNERDDRTLLRLSRNDRRRSSQELAKLWKDSSNVNVTHITGRRRLLNNGYRGCVAAKKHLLSKKNVQERLKWCKIFKTWSIDN